jgi:superoxide dismutase, Cu-Zn family
MKKIAAVMVMALLALMVGCERAAQHVDDHTVGEESADGAATHDAANAVTAVAELQPLGENGATGRVTFTQTEHGVRVVAEVGGLSEGTHGFHLHRWGDCSSPDGKSAGGHYNPMGVDHAGPDAPEAHAGDLGNIEADADGNATLDWTSDRIQLTDGRTDIRGRSVVLHVDADDLTSQPTGAAGGRVACGVIREEGADTQPVLPEPEE